MAVRRLAILFVLAVLATMPALLAPAGAAAAVGDCAPGADWPASKPDFASRVVELVNQHRSQRGLGTLRVLDTLTNAAVWKARHMAKYRYMQHYDFAPPVSRTVGDRLTACGFSGWGWGENIAYGYATPEAVMQGWLASPGHRANIENASFNAIGVGAASEPGGYVYWAQNFGTVSSSGSTTPVQPAPAPAPAPAPSPTADLSVTHTDAPDPVALGGTVTYTITVRNNGPSSASGVVVTEQLPGGASLAAWRTSQGSCSGSSTLTCSLGTIASGGTATVTVDARPGSAGVASASASVSASTSDPSSANNSASTSTTVNAPVSAAPAPGRTGSHSAGTVSCNAGRQFAVNAPTIYAVNATAGVDSQRVAWRATISRWNGFQWAAVQQSAWVSGDATDTTPATTSGQTLTAPYSGWWRVSYELVWYATSAVGEARTQVWATSHTGTHGASYWCYWAS